MKEVRLSDLIFLYLSSLNKSTLCTYPFKNMKKLLFLSLAFLSMSFAPLLESEKLIGTWEYTATSEDDDSFTMKFQANGTVIMESDEEKLGGEKFYIGFRYVDENEFCYRLF